VLIRAACRPLDAILAALRGSLYMTCIRTSENSVKAKFAEFVLPEGEGIRRSRRFLELCGRPRLGNRAALIGEIPPVGLHALSAARIGGPASQGEH
jgi:hypothetical protein